MHAAVVRGILLAGAAQSLMSASDTVIKWLSASYPVFQVVVMQSCAVAAIATVMMLRAGVQGRLRLTRPWAVMVRGLLAGSGAASTYYAVSLLPLAEVYAITFCAPLLVAAAAGPLLGEHVGWQKWLAVFVGLIGVLIMLRPDGSSLSAGHAAALTAACVGAAVTLLVRRFGANEEREVMIGAIAFGHLAASLPLAAAHLSPPGAGSVALAAVAGIAMLSGQVLFLEALRLAPAASIAPVQYIRLLWGLILGFLVFGNVPTAGLIGGGLIIVAAVAFLIYCEREERRQKIGED